MIVNLRWPHFHKWVTLKSSMDEYGVDLVCAKCLTESFHRFTPMQQIDYRIIQTIMKSDILVKKLMDD